MEQWWYAVGGERAGPIDLEALRTLWRQGAVDAATLAWHSGMAEWARIADIAELADLLPSAPAPEADGPPPIPPAYLAATVAPGAVATAGPWRRFLARAVDMLIVGIAINIVSRSAGEHVPFLYLTGTVTGLLITPLILLVETVFMATMGWTPGKKLLGVSVRTLDGHPPDLRQYGRRMVGLWWYGLGAGLPLINLIAMGRQYLHLRASEPPVWDAGRFQVDASTPGQLQWALGLAVMAVLTVVYLVMVLAR